MKKALSWVAVAVGLLIVAVIVLAYFIDEPLRRRTETKINSALKGYTVRIGKLDFHPIGFSLDLENSVITQDAQPDPPVAQIPNLTASVNWKALLSGRVVADFEINDPKFFLNLKQSETEIKDKVPVKERGWQEALESIYPLKINEFTISNGELTYVDQGPYRPLQVRNVNFRAQNIRNVRSKEGEYPSDVHLDGRVFEKGKIVLDGHADFLAEPHVAIKTDVTVNEIELNYFRPILERYHFSVRQGVLATAGTIEYAKSKKFINVPRIEIQRLVGDYMHDKPASSPTAELAKKTDKVIKEHSNEPTLELNVNDVNIAAADIGIVNKAAQPEYRLFLTDARIRIENLSNQSKEGVAVGTATGKFMGAGPAKFVMRMRPRGKSANFDFVVAIDQVPMKTLNKLFLAYGNFDVAGGEFSLYSEISVREGAIDGYVKPLFKDVDVYDSKQDQNKGILHKLYEGLIGGLTWVLQNKPREQVATTTRISGKLSSPQTSTFDIVLGLFQNAFFRAILPGLERSVENRPKIKRQNSG
jgi:Domain of Unknown Function (DUF748)